MLAGWWRMTAQPKGWVCTGKCCSHQSKETRLQEAFAEWDSNIYMSVFRRKGDSLHPGCLTKTLGPHGHFTRQLLWKPWGTFFMVNLNEFQFCSLEKERMLLPDSQEVYEKNHQSLWGLEELGMLSEGNLWIQYKEFPALVIKNCKMWL